MSAIDSGKRLYQRAVNLLSPRPIVFHHVPKCGGTSVGRALRRAYLLSQATVKPHESDKAFASLQASERWPGFDVQDFRQMMLLYLLHNDTRCVAAHVPFSEVAFNEFGDSYAFVTILRDPVDRFLSNYRWNQRPGRPDRPTETLDEFLAHARDRQTGATYVRYFCGDPGAERFTAQHVDAAIRNLHRLHCVGFLDALPRFEAELNALTGRRIRVGKENVGRTTAADAPLLTPANQDVVLAACALDRAVWDGVQDLRGTSTPPSDPSTKSPD